MKMRCYRNLEWPWSTCGFSLSGWDLQDEDFNFRSEAKISMNDMIQAPGLSHITRRKVTSPNVTARWRKVTSHGGKSHHFVTIPMAQRHPTENRKVAKFSRDIAHTEIFDDFYKQVCNEYQWHSVCHIASFEILSVPESQWHSDYYIVFFWQTFFDNPNGTACVI